MIGRLVCNNIARTSAMPRVVTAIGSTRSMAIGGDYASKVSIDMFMCQKSYCKERVM